MVRAILAIVCLTGLTACGLRGPLYLPAENGKANQDVPQALQRSEAQPQGNTAVPPSAQQNQ